MTTREAIRNLFTHYKVCFFTEPILLLTFLICFIIGILYNYGERARTVFLCYFFTGLMLFSDGALESMRVVHPKNAIKLEEIINSIFEFVEFLAFYYFFRKCLANSTFKSILNLFLGCLALFIVAFLTLLNSTDYTNDKIRKNSFFINTVEFFFIAFLCLAYFYELFTSAPTKNLSSRPSFLIATSAFFYAVLLIPFFIIARDLWENEKTLFFILSSCHYLLLTILLLTIAKAFLCKKPITT